MRALSSIAACCLLFVISLQAQDCPVIPMPAQAKASFSKATISRKGQQPPLVNAVTSLGTIHPGQEVFIITSQTPISCNITSFSNTIRLWQQLLLQYTSIPVSRPVANGSPAIHIEQDKSLTIKGAYHLQMSAEAVTIRAAEEEGLQNGLMSLLQLALQADKNILPDGAHALVLPCWNITDEPLYGWRGLMLDESRHFFGMKMVKTLLDQMALYKLNRFHWHLTDEPAWRIAMQQYPLLAAEGGKGSFTDSLAPAAYYTQAQISEIVAYAAARHITVIPEIDMPGHATAANKAYPAYSGGGSAKHPEFTFHPGKEETYQYLANILKEVNTLFPSGMIHIGGDEVSFGNDKWQQDAAVQALMKKHSLKDIVAVEHYFIRRMADTLRNLNSELLAWDEVVGANLDPKHTIAFWWRHEKPAQLTTALNKGFRVVLCPRLPFYYDFVQDSTHKKGRKWNGSYNSLDKVYNFSRTTLPVPAGKEKQILGIQANVWTETIVTPERLEYMLFPRVYALAEAAWSRPVQKDYARFLKRLQPHLSLLEKAGIRYYDPVAPGSTPEIGQ